MACTVRYADVYGILAAPPCTDFSLAKGNRPRDLAGAMETVESCMRVIKYCQIYGNLKFWALENPRGLLRQFLGKPAMTFEQWQWGDGMIKPTDIWGYFNPPVPTVRERPAALVNKHKYANSHGVLLSNPVCPPECAEYVGRLNGYQAKRAAMRAITPAGFAVAFYKANK